MPPWREQADIGSLQRIARRFLEAHKKFNGWQVEYVAIAPWIDVGLNAELRNLGVIPQDIAHLIQDL